MSEKKSLKRGEKLFDENKAPQSLIVVTSGRLNHNVTRSGKKIEINASHGNPVYGDEALFSSGKHLFCAEANSSVQYTEIALDLIKAQIEKLPQTLKILLRSLVEEVKSLRNFVKSTKLEQDNMACPQPMVARIFAALAIVTKQSGKKLPTGEWEISWETLKLYSTRFFLEKPNRVQGGIEILTKLGYAEMAFQKNEDEIEELHLVKIKNLDFVEQFAEFYQFYFYKPGRSEIIYYEKLAAQIVKNLVDISEGVQPDHNGHIRFVYDQMLKELKEKKNFDFKPDFVRVLERKGFLASRKSTDTSVLFLFDRKEFENTLKYWEVIREIDKWNESGRVKVKEAIETHVDEESCPTCQFKIEESHKFCPSCGHKLAA